MLVSHIDANCVHYTGDRLVHRLADRFESCMPYLHRSSGIDVVHEWIITNEFDSKRRPLSLAVFSNTSDVLDRFSASVIAAVVGVDTSNSLIINAEDLVLDDTSNSEAKDILRNGIVSTLSECPRRSIIILRNAQVLKNDRLPIWDIFLDPLNGARGQFYNSLTNEILDTSNSIFVFLFDIFGEDTLDLTWREFLVQYWSSEIGYDVFTPQALIGRISAGIELFGNPLRRPLKGFCELGKSSTFVFDSKLVVSIFLATDMLMLALKISIALM